VDATAFTLSFQSFGNDTAFPPETFLYPSTLVTQFERKVVSFPEGNAVNYSNNANHFMFISLNTDWPSNLTLTFIDTAFPDSCVGFAIGDKTDTTRFSKMLDTDIKQLIRVR